MNAHFQTIVSDLDGTLLKNHLEVTENTRLILHAAQQKGIELVIATGRPFQLIKKYMDELPFVNYFILNNGAAVYSRIKNDYLFQSFIEQADIASLIHFAEVNATDFELHTHNALVVSGEKRQAFFKAYVNRLPESFKPHIVQYRAPEDHLDVTKMMLIQDDIKRYHSLKAELQNIPHLSIVQSQDTYIDVNVQNISKGAALKRLADTVGWDKNQIIALGDQENDHSMLDYAGTAVAMGNAVQSVKEIADMITDSSDNDGVYQALKKLGI